MSEFASKFMGYGKSITFYVIAFTHVSLSTAALFAAPFAAFSATLAGFSLVLPLWLAGPIAAVGCYTSFIFLSHRMSKAVKEIRTKTLVGYFKQQMMNCEGYELLTLAAFCLLIKIAVRRACRQDNIEASIDKSKVWKLLDLAATLFMVPVFAINGFKTICNFRHVIGLVFDWARKLLDGFLTLNELMSQDEKPNEANKVVESVNSACRFVSKKFEEKVVQMLQSNQPLPAEKETKENLSAGLSELIAQDEALNSRLAHDRGIIDDDAYDEEELKARLDTWNSEKREMKKTTSGQITRALNTVMCSPLAPFFAVIIVGVFVGVVLYVQKKESKKPVKIAALKQAAAKAEKAVLEGKASKARRKMKRSNNNKRRYIRTKPCKGHRWFDEASEYWMEYDDDGHAIVADDQTPEYFDDEKDAESGFVEIDDSDEESMTESGTTAAPEGKKAKVDNDVKVVVAELVDKVVATVPSAKTVRCTPNASNELVSTCIKLLNKANDPVKPCSKPVPVESPKISELAHVRESASVHRGVVNLQPALQSTGIVTASKGAEVRFSNCMITNNRILFPHHVVEGCDKAVVSFWCDGKIVRKEVDKWTLIAPDCCSVFYDAMFNLAAKRSPLTISLLGKELSQHNPIAIVVYASVKDFEANNPTTAMGDSIVGTCTDPINGLMLQYTLDTHQGYCGAPVVNCFGKLLAIHHAGGTPPSAVNEGIVASFIPRFTNTLNSKVQP